MKCQQCSGNVIEDSGEMVCTQCGIVAESAVETPAIDHFASSNVVDAFAFGDHILTTMGAANKDHSGKLCAMIGNLKRMRRSNTWSQPHNRSIPTAMAQLSKLSNELHMSQACSIFAANLMRRLIDAGFLIGRTLANCTAAVALVACRKHSMNTTMEAVAEIADVDQQKLYHMYRTIVRKYDVVLPVQDPVEHIAWIAGKMGLSETVKRDAHHILQSVDRIYVGGKDPKGLAASALYTSCVARGERVQRGDIAKIAGVAGTTLTNRYKTLRNYMPEHVAAEVPRRGRRAKKPDRI